MQMSHLASLREEAGLTQRALALRAGRHWRTIQQLESGASCQVSTAVSIAAVLTEELGRDVTVADLFASEVAS